MPKPSLDEPVYSKATLIGCGIIVFAAALIFFLMALLVPPTPWSMSNP